MLTPRKWAFNLTVCAVFLFSNCNDHNEDFSEDDFLIFGTFYGECIGEACVEIYLIQGGSLFEDIEDRYPDGGSQDTGNYVELSNESYQRVKDLYDSIPMNLWNTTDGTIGCPDCTDGGGVYIEIKNEGVIKTWMLDNFLTRIPEEYHEVVNTVHEAVEILN